MTSLPDIMFDLQTVLNALRMIETSVQIVLFFLECLRKCLVFFGNFSKGFEKVRVADKFCVYQYFKIRHGCLSIWNISLCVQLYISFARYPYLFFSEASQRSGILNPWIWLANSARARAVRIFPHGPRVRTAPSFPTLRLFYQLFVTVKISMKCRSFTAQFKIRENWISSLLK